MKDKTPKIALIILICACFFSCSLTKRVPENQSLLIKTEILENGKKTTREATLNQLYQRPNSSKFGFNWGLQLYNLAKPNADSSYNVWLEKNPTIHKNLTALISEKQVQGIGRSFLVYGINDFLKDMGEAPVLYNKNKTDLSALRLKNYYFNRGFFNTQVKSQVEDLGNKKTKVSYAVQTGHAYEIDSVFTTINTPALDSLFQKNTDKPYVRINKIFNSKDFVNERKRISSYFRDNGVYNFQENNVHYDIDTIRGNHKAIVELIVDDRSVKSGDTIVQVPFKIYNISDVNIFIDNNISKNNGNKLDSVSYNNFNIYSGKKMKFRPKALTDAIFITKGSPFSDIKRSLTSRSISNLRVFNYPSIEYVEDVRDTTGQSLITNIYLLSKKKVTLNPSLDVTNSNIQTVGISGNLGLVIRNIFRGAEILEIGLRGNIGSSRHMSNPDNIFFNVSEYGTDVKLSFPRLFFPLKTEKIISKTMLPTTMVRLGFSRQQNIGLDKENLTAVINYNWTPKRNTGYSFDLFNLQYVRNTNPSNYFSVYKSSFNTLNNIAHKYEINSNYVDKNGNLSIGDGGANMFIHEVLSKGHSDINSGSDDYKTIRSIEERRKRLSENNLILGVNINYTKSSRSDIKDNDFYTFRTKFVSAGALLNLILKDNSSSISENSNKTFFEVEYSQYLKTEIDYVKYWDIGMQQVIAIHAFGGIAIPYGNSNSIPFSRSYFAGGSNDNRAWQSYRLGPGKSGSINDFNEANMKLMFSAEYRFNIFQKWNGALFIDAGNIWNVFDQVKTETHVFKNLKSLENIAIGSGIGLRYDFEFFVFRIDLGFKTYNPANKTNEKWFKDFKFKQSVFNVGINYPF